MSGIRGQNRCVGRCDQLWGDEQVSNVSLLLCGAVLCARDVSKEPHPSEGDGDDGDRVCFDHVGHCQSLSTLSYVQCHLASGRL